MSTAPSTVHHEQFLEQAPRVPTLTLVPAPASAGRPTRRRRRGPGGLTRRELEVLRLVSGGATNRAVAATLWVTDQTVKFHLSNVYRKLGVRNRFEAARWAWENGLLDDDESTEHATVGLVTANGR
jgi:DNA-binding CsgD family transcriptional regulator